jgi:hypothetical protein
VRIFTLASHPPAQDFTLEELLNDDEILQELRNQNKKLTE